MASSHDPLPHGVFSLLRLEKEEILSEYVGRAGIQLLKIVEMTDSWPPGQSPIFSITLEASVFSLLAQSIWQTYVKQELWSEGFAYPVLAELVSRLPISVCPLRTAFCLEMKLRHFLCPVLACHTVEATPYGGFWHSSFFCQGKWGYCQELTCLNVPKDLKIIQLCLNAMFCESLRLL